MTRTILVADDSLAVHRAMEKCLSERDDEIRLAASGDEALELFEGGRPDVALIDIHMPGVSGYEVATRIKSAAPDLPVLLMVGTFEPYDEELASRSRADGSLMKPFDGAGLLERLDELTGYEPAEPSAEPEAAGVSAPEDVASPEGGADDRSREAQRRPAEAVAAERGDTAGDEGGPADESTEEAIAEPSAEPAATLVDGPSSDGTLSDGDVERIARRVVELLSSDVVERVAREILPEIAESAVRRRIEELEREEE